ncbi:MAG TPA: hypothetical protein VGC05_17625, partial [Mycobacterium sp.]
MNNAIQTQYATGLTRRNIEQALIAAGKDLDHLTPANLGLLEDFHTMGRIATSQLVDLAEISSTARVLDTGSGVEYRTLRRRPLRLPGYRRGSDRRVLRNESLAQPTRRPPQPDRRSTGTR